VGLIFDGYSDNCWIIVLKAKSELKQNDGLTHRLEDYRV
jgi:hypothetical protein